MRWNRNVIVLSVVVCVSYSAPLFKALAQQDLIDDNGDPTTPEIAELRLDNDLYALWRSMGQGTNPVPAQIVNSVASDRLSVSRILLGRINSWVTNYMAVHSNEIPNVITDMPVANRTCPITQQPFTYFPVNISNRVVELIVSIVPSSIPTVSVAETNVYVLALLGNGEIRDFDGPGFVAYANSNNIVRSKALLPTIPTNLIYQLSRP